MPWTHTPTTEHRLKFAPLANSGRFTVTELCVEFGISRKDGPKWLVRHAEGGAEAHQRAPSAHDPDAEEDQSRVGTQTSARFGSAPKWGQRANCQTIFLPHGFHRIPLLN